MRRRSAAQIRATVMERSCRIAIALSCCEVFLVARIYVFVSVWSKAKGKVQDWGCAESLPRQNRFSSISFSRNPQSSLIIHNRGTSSFRFWVVDVRPCAAEARTRGGKGRYIAIHPPGELRNRRNQQRSHWQEVSIQSPLRLKTGTTLRKKIYLCITL